MNAHTFLFHDRRYRRTTEQLRLTTQAAVAEERRDRRVIRRNPEMAIIVSAERILRAQPKGDA